MTPIPVPRRWLATLLGISLLLDTVMVISGDQPRDAVLALPGAAIFAVAAWLGIDRPAIASIVGAMTLTVSSILLRSASVLPPSVALSHIMLTELISGIVLVVMVVWRTAPLVATACTTALVAACLASIFIREPYCDGFDNCYYYRTGLVRVLSPSDVLTSMLFGFVLLVGAVATGIYLRRSSQQRVETEMSALVRKQWPLGAALAALSLIELSEGGYSNLLGFASSIVAGVCAFFGPKYPLRNTWLAAAGFTASGLPGAMFGSGPSDWRLPIAGLAASMALVSYVVRYAEPKKAAGATAGLSASYVFAMAAATRSLAADSDFMLLLGFLLLVSIAAGWYFRARDRERNQTVAAAVTSAQQGERMALARELHDVVAHHVTGIVVQAQAALLVAQKNPDVAVTALARIEHSGTEALTAMRSLVGSLRDGTSGWAADVTDQATTDVAADIHALVENYPGPPAELDLHLPSELPHEVGRSVLRLVQESLTNVGKHAPDASLVQVRVVQAGDELHIRVTDDGAARPAHPAGGSGGYGLVGMRERVELLGGRFEAGPSGFVGWNVEAWLPLRKEGT